RDELMCNFLFCLFCNSSQLLLRHFTVRRVVDSIGLAAAFNPPHRTPKLDHCSCIAMKVFRRRLERRFSYQHFTNDICHEIETLATVGSFLLSSHKRRYENEHESM